MWWGSRGRICWCGVLLIRRWCWAVMVVGGLGVGLWEGGSRRVCWSVGRRVRRLMGGCWRMGSRVFRVGIRVVICDVPLILCLSCTYEGVSPWKDGGEEKVGREKGKCDKHHAVLQSPGAACSTEPFTSAPNSPSRSPTCFHTAATLPNTAINLPPSVAVTRPPLRRPAFSSSLLCQSVSLRILL